VKSKKNKKIKVCWLCGGTEPEPDSKIITECETPGGKSCKPKKVDVHFSCYMDMDG